MKTPWQSHYRSVSLKTPARQAKIKEVSVLQYSHINTKQSDVQLLFGLTSSVIAAFVVDASFASLAVYSNSVKDTKRT